jgi:hypothetical protein
MMLRTLYDYIEILLSPLPEAVRWFSTQTPDGFADTVEKLITRAIAHLEASGNHLRNCREDTITCAAIGFLNNYGIQASSQTNSRGHVDIFIKHGWHAMLVICGEAKIWRGAAKHTEGLAQVMNYTTGRYPYCFVFAYVQSGHIKSHIETLRNHLDTILPEAQQGPCCGHGRLTWGLLTQHRHTSGEVVRVLHAAVNLV